MISILYVWGKMNTQSKNFHYLKNVQVFSLDKCDLLITNRYFFTDKKKYETYNKTDFKLKYLIMLQLFLSRKK